MKRLKNIFDFYIHASIHVSIATWALVCLTFHIFQINFDWVISGFVFFSTIFSYNFIKYYNVLLKSKTSFFFKAIIFVSLLSGIFSFVLFLKLSIYTKFCAVLFSILTLLYAIPLGKHKNNLRNIAGIKVYIVSFCWAGVTILLPLFNSDFDLNSAICSIFLQRFFLILILILIFEIIDLKSDDLRLKTVPQSIGIKYTKWLIYILLLIFFILEFFMKGTYINQWSINLILVTIVFLFTYFANTNRGKYYTLFWVESIPILWLFLTYFFN